MKREGFTLIELLVVIAIIALIIAISLPSLQNSRQQAKAVICSSHISQLLLDMAIYETKNETFPYAFDDTLLEPPPGGFPGDFMYDRLGWFWFNHIIDYSRKDSGKDSVIWCPSRVINDISLKDNVLCGNYGVNLSICKSKRGRKSQAEFVGTSLSSRDILHPSRTLLIIDSGYSMISWWHVTDVPPMSLGSTIEDNAYVPGLKINNEKNLLSGQKRDAINGRHTNKTVNVGFADGHVERKKADELFVEKTETNYKNRYPLWRPMKNNND